MLIQISNAWRQKIKTKICKLNQLMKILMISNKKKPECIGIFVGYFATKIVNESGKYVHIESVDFQAKHLLDWKFALENVYSWFNVSS